MKILIILFICTILLGPILFENSYGLTTESKKILPIKIFFKMELRDKYGHLYGYSEPILQVFDVARAVKWVTAQGTNSTVVYQGHNYLLWKFKDHLVEAPNEQVGAYFLAIPENGHRQTVFYFHHDGYLTSPGDISTVYWEVLVPLQ
jgi:carbonic anhydrase